MGKVISLEERLANRRLKTEQQDAANRLQQWRLKLGQLLLELGKEEFPIYDEAFVERGLEIFGGGDGLPSILGLCLATRDHEPDDEAGFTRTEVFILPSCQYVEVHFKDGFGDVGQARNFVREDQLAEDLDLVGDMEVQLSELYQLMSAYKK